jgi:hypothetical protein
MHGVESYKIVDAQQAKLTDNYRNTKHKLLKSNAGDKCKYLAYYVHLVGTKRSNLLKSLLIFQNGRKRHFSANFLNETSHYTMH